MDWEKLDFIQDDDRLFTMVIEGVVYPLCLTVKANKIIDRDFGNVSKVGDVLREHADKEEITTLMQMTNKLLMALISGGLARCAVKAKMRGEKIELPDLPDDDDLDGLFTYEDMATVQQAIFAALNGGAKRNVETAPDKSPKNVETATSSN